MPRLSGRTSEPDPHEIMPRPSYQGSGEAGEARPHERNNGYAR